MRGAKGHERTEKNRGGGEYGCTLGVGGGTPANDIQYKG